MTEEQREDAGAELHDLFDEIREALDKHLGGDPENNRTDRVVPDGGSE